VDRPRTVGRPPGGMTGNSPSYSVRVSLEPAASAAPADGNAGTKSSSRGSKRDQPRAGLASGVADAPVSPSGQAEADQRARRVGLRADVGTRRRKAAAASGPRRARGTALSALVFELPLRRWPSGQRQSACPRAGTSGDDLRVRTSGVGSRTGNQAKASGSAPGRWSWGCLPGKGLRARVRATTHGLPPRQGPSGPRRGDDPRADTPATASGLGPGRWSSGWSPGDSLRAGTRASVLGADTTARIFGSGPRRRSSGRFLGKGLRVRARETVHGLPMQRRPSGRRSGDGSRAADAEATSGSPTRRRLTNRQS
jgi:hypothetical protein